MTDATLFDDAPARTDRLVQLVKPEVETIEAGDPGHDHILVWSSEGRVGCMCGMLLRVSLSFEPMVPVDVSQLGPFVRESETSRQAALANYPRQGSQRWLILRYLFDRQEEGRPGATREELSVELGMSPDSVRPRCVELRRGGWICAVASGAHATDAEETRRTALGQDAEVLVLTVTAVERLQHEPV